MNLGKKKTLIYSALTIVVLAIITVGAVSVNSTVNHIDSLNSKVEKLSAKQNKNSKAVIELNKIQKNLEEQVNSNKNLTDAEKKSATTKLDDLQKQVNSLK